MDTNFNFLSNLREKFCQALEFFSPNTSLHFVRATLAFNSPWSSIWFMTHPSYSAFLFRCLFDGTKALYDEIIQMRAGGRKVSRKWIMLRMKQLLKLSPTDKSRITTGWLTGFLKRKKLSRQKLRNNKKVSVYERIHEVFNFHWYVLYKAQDERPEDPAIFQSSDEESSAEDSTED